jgi:hypothetical protein
MTPTIRRGLRKIAIAILGSGATVVAAGYGLEQCAIRAMCGDEDVGRFESPNHARAIRIFVRDCGATTTWATIVELRERRRLLPDKSETVFVADRHGGAPAGPGYGPEVRVRWLDDTAVVLAHHVGATVFRSEARVGRVGIRYEVFR